jgi:hypothetical protein
MVDDGGDSAGTDGTGSDGVATPTPGLEERIKRLPLNGILGSAAAVLVVGLVVGLGAGYKIEQSRVKHDVSKANARASESAAQPQAQGPSSIVQFRGKVATAAANTVNVTVLGATKALVTNKATIVVKASPGAPTDIVAGVRVLWQAKKGQPTQADAVLVLPASAKLGTPVLSATATSMTFKRGAKNVTVTTNGATVEKVTPATVTDIAAGAKVVAQVRQTNTVVELIVLPDNSTFAP